MIKKEIAIEEFEILAVQDQLDILRKDGVHVGKRQINGKAAILYQLHNFYIELIYHDYRKVIKSLSVSNDLSMLQPYLLQIKVRDLDIGNM